MCILGRKGHVCMYPFCSCCCCFRSRRCCRPVGVSRVFGFPGPGPGGRCYHPCGLPHRGQATRTPPAAAAPDRIVTVFTVTARRQRAALGGPDGSGKPQEDAPDGDDVDMTKGASFWGFPSVGTLRGVPKFPPVSLVWSLVGHHAGRLGIGILWGWVFLRGCLGWVPRRFGWPAGCGFGVRPLKNLPYSFVFRHRLWFGFNIGFLVVL